MENKWKGAIASAIIPGLGQFILDKPARGVAVFIAFVVFGALSWLTFLPLGAIVWALGVFDAYLIGEGVDGLEKYCCEMTAK